MSRDRGHSSEPRKKKSPVGVTRAGIVYEVFLTNLPQHAFTTCDVVELYLHRGAIRADTFRPRQRAGPGPLVQPLGLGTRMLATGGPIGVESPPGTGTPTSSRFCAHASLLLLLFRLLHRTRLPLRAMLLLTWARAGSLAASRARTLPSSPMGRCVAPASQKLVMHEQRREANGSLRVVYGVSIRSCRPCPLREQCQWQGHGETAQVSVRLASIGRWSTVHSLA